MCGEGRSKIICPFLTFLGKLERMPRASSFTYECKNKNVNTKPEHMNRQQNLPHLLQSNQDGLIDDYKF